ncbi:MAG: hypothetical protein ABI262_10805 [Microcoleus sp.]
MPIIWGEWAAIALQVIFLVIPIYESIAIDRVLASTKASGVWGGDM